MLVNIESFDEYDLNLLISALCLSTTYALFSRYDSGYNKHSREVEYVLFPFSLFLPSSSNVLNVDVTPLFTHTSSHRRYILIVKYSANTLLFFILITASMRERPQGLSRLFRISKEKVQVAQRGVGIHDENTPMKLRSVGF